MYSFAWLFKRGIGQLKSIRTVEQVSIRKAAVHESDRGEKGPSRLGKWWWWW